MFTPTSEPLLPLCPFFSFSFTLVALHPSLLSAFLSLEAVQERKDRRTPTVEKVRKSSPALSATLHTRLSCCTLDIHVCIHLRAYIHKHRVHPHGLGASTSVSIDAYPRRERGDVQRGYIHTPSARLRRETTTEERNLRVTRQPSSQPHPAPHQPSTLSASFILLLCRSQTLSFPWTPLLLSLPQTLPSDLCCLSITAPPRLSSFVFRSPSPRGTCTNHTAFFFSPCKPPTPAS